MSVTAKLVHPQLAQLCVWAHVLSSQSNTLQLSQEHSYDGADDVCLQGVHLNGKMNDGQFHHVTCRYSTASTQVFRLDVLGSAKLASCCLATPDELISCIADEPTFTRFTAYQRLLSMKVDDRVKRILGVSEPFGGVQHELASALRIINIADDLDADERSADAAANSLGITLENYSNLLRDELAAKIEQNRCEVRGSQRLVDDLCQETAALYGIDPDQDLITCGVDKTRRMIDGDIVARTTILDALEVMFAASRAHRNVITVPRWVYDTLVLLGGRSSISAAYPAVGNELLSTAETLWLENEGGELGDFDHCVLAAGLL
jgi:hypothetical protein